MSAKMCDNCQERPAALQAFWQGEPVGYCAECYDYDFGENAERKSYNPSAKELEPLTLRSALLDITAAWKECIEALDNGASPKEAQNIMDSAFEQAAEALRITKKEAETCK